MKKLVFVALGCFTAAAAFAADKETQAEKSSNMKGEIHGVMSGKWQPHAVTRERDVRKELDVFYKNMDDAMARNDTTAANAVIDFPVLMMTDNSQGQGRGESVDRDRYTQMMSDSMKQVPANISEAVKKAKLERKYELLTDSLAFVTTTRTLKLEGQKGTTWKSGELLQKRDGQWRVKAMVEGGWGDAMGSPGTGGAGTQDKGSMDKGSMDKGSMDKGSMDKGSMDKGSMDKGTQDNPLGSGNK